MDSYDEYDEDFDDDFDVDEGDVDESDDEATIACPYCGDEMYEDAPQCPHCGQYITAEDGHREPKPWWIVAGVIACLVALLWWIVR